jgi:hypothetical protein
MQKGTGTISRENQYLKLVDQFYKQNRNMISLEDYVKAKKDSVHFKALIWKVTGVYQAIGRVLLLMDKNCHVWLF